MSSGEKTKEGRAYLGRLFDGSQTCLLLFASNVDDRAHSRFSIKRGGGEPSHNSTHNLCTAYTQHTQYLVLNRIYWKFFSYGLLWEGFPRLLFMSYAADQGTYVSLIVCIPLFERKEHPHTNDQKGSTHSRLVQQLDLCRRILSIT